MLLSQTVIVVETSAAGFSQTSHKGVDGEVSSKQWLGSTGHGSVEAEFFGTAKWLSEERLSGGMAGFEEVKERPLRGSPSGVSRQTSTGVAGGVRCGGYSSNPLHSDFFIHKPMCSLICCGFMRYWQPQHSALGSDPRLATGRFRQCEKRVLRL